MSDPVFTHTSEEVMLRENSFGVVTPPTKTTMTTRIWMWESRPSRGSFEWTGGDFHADGGLWFNDKGMLVDFDGTFDLPPAAIKWLYDEGRLTPWYIDLWTKSGRLEVSE